jgi:hypothetical protein
MSDLTVPLSEADFLLTQLWLLRGTLRLTGPGPLDTPRQACLGRADTIAGALYCHVELETRLVRSADVIHTAVPLLLQTRASTLQVGAGHYGCAAEGLIHLSVVVREDLRWCVGRLAEAAGGVRALHDKLDLLSKAVALAWRPGAAREPVTEAVREQLGAVGLPAYERLRVDRGFRAAAGRVRHRRLLERMRPFLGVDLCHLRAEVHHEFTRAHAPQAPAAPEARAEIVSLGGRRYQASNTAPVVLTEREDAVLQAFANEPAMDKPRLIKLSGYDEAARILAAIRRRHPTLASAIRLPGARGRGGYHVAVRSPSSPA